MSFWVRDRQTADQTLHREDGVVGVGHRLALGRLADQALTILGEGDDRRRGARTFRIFDDLGLAPSITATQLLVVPRSIPITLPISPIPKSSVTPPLGSPEIGKAARWLV
jgi:hypothetical protein